MAEQSQQQIMARWTSAQPLVSILCTTYNHEAYIKAALDGFLMQETNFPFEIIIHDDASGDQTPSIIRDYCRAYPQLLKPILQQENQYSKGISSLLTALSAAQGDYIAICEGDDYWTDPHKLQTQADYLNAHSDFSMMAHAVTVLDETITGTSYTPYAPVLKRVHYFDDILREHFIPTLSLMIRKSAIPKPMPAFFYQIISRDIAIELLAASLGPCYYDAQPRGVYRHHDSGMTKTPIHPTKERALRYTLYLGLLDYLGQDYQKPLRQKLAWVDLVAAVALLRDYRSFNGILFAKALIKDPWVIFKILLRKYQRWSAAKQPIQPD